MTKPDQGNSHVIVPTHSSKMLPVQEYSEDNNPLSRSNRLSGRSWKLVFKRVWTDFWFDALMDRGATMTFFSLLAFAPTVLAAYSVATLLFASRRSDVERLTDQFIADFVPDSLVDNANQVVAGIVGSAAEGAWALTISVLISLFSASGYVRAFSRTANMVYGRVEGRGIIRTWAMMWGLTLMLVVGGVLVLFANLLRDTVVNGIIVPIARPLGVEGFVDYMLDIFLPIWDWLRFPVTVIVVLTLIALLYHYAPNVKPLRFRWITLGSIVALTVSVASWALFGLYLTYFAGTSAYGAISTVMTLIIAVWAVNIGLVVGVKLDAEVLRAKELQRGMPSERYIQAPPRSDVAAQAQARAQQTIEEHSSSVARTGEEQEAEARQNQQPQFTAAGTPAERTDN